MCVMEQVELLVSIVLRAVIVVAVILATLVVTIYVLTVLGLDERRAGELGVALSLAIVVYLVLQATAGSHQCRAPTPTGITASTGATVTVTGDPLAIFTLNPEETGALNWIYFDPPKLVAVTPGSGLTIQQYATAGVGLFNAVMYFGVEGVRP